MALRTLRQRTEDSTFELDLAPMLSMIVALIPILLLSVVFVRITLIDTPIPQVVAEAIEKEKDNKLQIEVTLSVSLSGGFDLSVLEGGRKVSALNIPVTAGALNFDSLNQQLISVKQKYPNHYTLILNPSEDVSYNDIIKTIDSARESKDPNAKFKVIDSKTQSEVEHKMMFPNVNFGNVVEG